MKATAIEQPRAATFRRPRRRGIITLLALLLLVAGGGVGAYYWKTVQDVPVAVKTTTVPVQKGNLSAQVSASGTITATTTYALQPGTAGTLQQVSVTDGMEVKKDQVLAKLDTSSLELKVSQAQAALAEAQLSQQEISAPAKPAELAAASASYQSASAKYNDLASGATPEEISAAEGAVRDAQVALDNAKRGQVVTNNSAAVQSDVRTRQNEYNWYQTNYGEMLNKFAGGEITQDKLNVEYSNMMASKERLESAKAQAEINAVKADNDVKSAQDKLTAAQTALDTLRKGTTSQDLKTAEAAMLNAQVALQTKQEGATEAAVMTAKNAVLQAELNLKEAQLALDKAQMKAPFDGRVVAVGAQVGDSVTATTTVVTLIDPNAVAVQASVEETDAVKLKVGQKATITVDAITGKTLQGEVSSVASQATVSSGVVLYKTLVKVANPDASLRTGMSAVAAITTEERTGVLLVPLRAVKGTGAKATVQVMVNGVAETRSVTTGMSNDTYTEITKGLNEGDQVVVTGTTATAGRVDTGSLVPGASTGGTGQIQGGGPPAGGPPAGP